MSSQTGSRPYRGPFPPPQSIRFLGGSVQLDFVLASDSQAASEAAWLGRELASRGLYPSATNRRLELSIDATRTAPAEGFHLELSSERTLLTARDAAGLRYGSLALLDLIDQATEQTPRPAPLPLPACEIDDWPDFAHRGVMLDVSRDKVPTMETLIALVEQLSRWRINQLQLYMEHTFAYRGHEVVWRDASPFTAEEIQALDRFCRERFIELVPNQNCLGHFHRWLIHPEYRPLAECPDGFITAFTPGGEPYSLCPTDPRTFHLLEDLFDQLLPNFTSRVVNVGLDETFDLGHGRSAKECAERGTERVYLDFVREVHARLARRGYRMQFWGDIILKRPELIRELPADAVALEWGYEADHPFAEEAAHFAAAGLEFYVCPGTSSWNSIGGRSENAIRNLANAARNGSAAGASGYLITDWGDHGHWQPLPVSYLGLLAGAAFAWNRTAALDWAPRDDEPMSDALRTHWCDLLDRLVYHDASKKLGAVTFDLGCAGQATGARNRNGSPLFRFLHFADRAWPHPEIEGLTREGLARAESLLASLPPELAQARSSREDAGTIADEHSWAIDLLRFAVRLGLARFDAGDGRLIGEIEPSVRRPLAEELLQLAERHTTLWVRRNRPGGLSDSTARFERIASRLNG